MFKEEEIRFETLKDIAQKMLVAARTAPKAKGNDNMVLAVIEGEEIKKLSAKTQEMGEYFENPTFLRDAKNVLAAQLVVLFGTKIKSIDLKKCGMCGFANCQEKDKYQLIPCVFNTGDLGIAIGSAVSIAMDNRIDNRVMYTVGQAAVELAMLGRDVRIVYAVPLSIGAKNPFFDR